MNVYRDKETHPLAMYVPVCFAETESPFQERVSPQRSFGVGSAVCTCPAGRGGGDGAVGTSLDSGKGGLKARGPPSLRGVRRPLSLPASAVRDPDPCRGSSRRPQTAGPSAWLPPAHRPSQHSIPESWHAADSGGLRLVASPQLLLGPYPGLPASSPALGDK